MRYCIKCVLPDSRPNLFISENGICSACIAHANRKKRDGEQSKKTFLKIIKDCLEEPKRLFLDL